MKKTSRQKLFIYGIVEIHPKLLFAADQHLLKSFFGVIFVYNYGHRTRITVSYMENANPQDDSSLEGFLTVHCIHATYFVKSWGKCARLEQSPNL
jgi:hypothetical protein